MKEVIKKLDEARKFIKNSDLKKSGKAGNFAYYTPEQVSTLVYQACNKTNLFHHFNLIKVDDVMQGVLTIYDLDSDDSIEFVQITDMPEMRNTNDAQRIGGAVTYTNRYMLMTAFNIVENSLDFDAVEQVKETFQGEQISTKPKGNIANALQLIQMAKDSAQLTNVKVKLNDLYWTTEETLEIKRTLTDKKDI
jgi:hypothetical protein